MFILRLIKYVTVIIIALYGVAIASNWRINSLVVFGGGDSDNGRGYDLYNIPVMPPYWHGRFSNGPAWDEYLAFNLRLIPNPEKNPNYDKNKFFLAYAYYYATATKKYNSDGRYLMTLDDEVTQYENNPKPFVHNTLVAVYAGENDLFDPKCLADPLTCLQDVTNAEKNALMRLCKLGVRHFLVFTPGDQDDIPYFVREYDYKTRQDLLQIESNYARSFADLKQSTETQCPKSQVLVFSSADYEPKWMQTFNQPTHIPCYWNVNSEGQFIYDKQIGTVCSDPNKYYYFDSFYATAAANKLLGNAVYKAVLKNKWDSPPVKHWWQRIF